MIKTGKTHLLVIAMATFVLLSCQAAFAGGRLLATGGVTQVEGSAGAGIVPWALISGTETQDEVGGTAFYTHIAMPNYGLDVAGASIGIKERLELSYARQTLSIDDNVTTPINTALALPTNTLSNTTLSQDVFGAKLKLFGNAVYDQNSMLPQISLGVQHKTNDDFKSVLGITGVPEVLGAKNPSGTDFYLAFTKIFIGGAGGLNLVVNGTIRETEANENGLLGFGCATTNAFVPTFVCKPGTGGYSTQGEGSAAVFLNPQTALGGEYRMMPDDLVSTQQDAWKDVFVAYFPSKEFALVLAYASLGNLPAGIGANGITKE